MIHKQIGNNEPGPQTSPGQQPKDGPKSSLTKKMGTEGEYERVIRNVYHVAEIKDIDKWVACFTDDGIFNDVSAGAIYRGPKELGITVEIYAKAFPDMHRELYDIYVSGDVVVVELSLNGTHRGPLQLPIGTIPPTGKVMKTPCCDVFRLKNGKVQSFNCYTAATILFSQIGVLPNLEAVLVHHSAMDGGQSPD